MMFFGMSRSLGRLDTPWSVAANLALLLQFPLAHSALLGRRGAKLLARSTQADWPRPCSDNLRHHCLHAGSFALSGLVS